MATSGREISLGFSDRRLHEGAHIIYLFGDDREQKRTMAQYLRQGLEENEKVLYLVHQVTPEEMCQELRTLGVDTAVTNGALQMLEAHYKQCPGEHFSAEYMLGVVGDYYEGAISEGFAGARGVGDMSWAAQGERVDFDELLDYEVELTRILQAHPLTTICQYDVRLFPGQVLLDLLCVHPVAIVNGQMVNNPFYLPPDRLRARKAESGQDQ